MRNLESLKNRAISFGWIIGLLFFLSLLWILTQPVQKHYLLRTINNVLIANGDSRRVMDYKGVKDGKTGLLGYWFLMYDSPGSMFVFAAFQDGILIPLGAVVSADGAVEDIIPLSDHAAQITDKLPASVLQVYVTRIEAAALTNKKGGK
jgi:hypothetical protein